MVTKITTSNLGAGIAIAGIWFGGSNITIKLLEINKVWGLLLIGLLLILTGFISSAFFYEIKTSNIKHDQH